MIQVTVLSFLLTAILDWAAARASRSTLGMDASKTLGGTIATRAAAWWVAWLLVRPQRERPDSRSRLHG